MLIIAQCTRFQVICEPTANPEMASIKLKVIEVEDIMVYGFISILMLDDELC